MSANFNKVILAGNLTRDPEIRHLQDGAAVVKFSIAINRRTKSKKESVDYFDIVAWEKLAEHCNTYLRKGSGVLIEGALRNRSYENKDGEKRRATEIVASSVTFLDRKPTTEEDDAEGDSFAAEGDLDEIPF